MDLVMRFSFEEIVYLLWHSYIPSQSQLNIFSQTLKIYRKSPLYVYKLIEKLLTEIDMLSKIRTVISSINTNEIKSRPTIDEAIQLTAAMPVIIANLYRKEKNLDFVLPSQEFNHIENYLYMITGKILSSIHSKVLETYMILTMEHGLNASTFAARVITSTETDMVSVVSGALGVMKGTLHGGALLVVFNMLNEIKKMKYAESWMRKKLKDKERIMGFSH
ncbi:MULTISPECIES: citrate/2-methylcitrate synthase [Bacillus]|nr:MULTISPECIES: citrate/2-methylcitrate synthase [Bacillus cereus group]MBJ7949073.1 citrate/2-methylcitrate synthase [Bacillus cereus group sp. N24]MBJ8133026.1 citrate/2-methylcitrate synthase [Bacillus cereus group sp. N3]MCU5490454.1 citrate/2-methylcitrate synthase [Bacillus cereus]PDZ93641.1 citrate synthase [Bacillus thuringiensis]PEB28391.1 citrate synthase [Bacillus toyonensis]